MLLVEGCGAVGVEVAAVAVVGADVAVVVGALEGLNVAFDD